MVACKLATPVDAAVGKENWCKRFKQVWGLRVRLSYCSSSTWRVDGPFGSVHIARFKRPKSSLSLCHGECMCSFECGFYSGCRYWLGWGVGKIFTGLPGDGFNDGLKRNDTAFCFGSSLNYRVVAGTTVVCLQPVEEALRTLETGEKDRRGLVCHQCALWDGLRIGQHVSVNLEEALMG